ARRPPTGSVSTRRRKPAPPISNSRDSRAALARISTCPSSRCAPLSSTAIRASMVAARSVRFAAFAIILATTALSAYRVAGRTLYWDDFLIAAAYGAPEQLSFTALFRPHDAHLMPGAIARQLSVERIAAL